ncbi:hypothetical protein GCM10027073_42100 [Streptomyces chlorus]
MRLGQVRASPAMSGAPTTMPTAKAEVRVDAAPMVTPRSAAMSGSRPASMNSEVPMAKTATESRYSGTGRGTCVGAVIGAGIEWLRGEERQERTAHLVTAVSAHGHTGTRPAAGGGGRRRDGRKAGSGVQGADGVTESPHLVRLGARHGPHAT